MSAEFSFNRFGHLPECIVSRNGIRSWVNAMIWEMDLPLHANLSDAKMTGQELGLNSTERRCFCLFFEQACRLDRQYLANSIVQETQSKCANISMQRANDGQVATPSRRWPRSP